MIISEVALLQEWLNPGLQLISSGPGLSPSSNSAFFYVGFILRQILPHGGELGTTSSWLTPWRPQGKESTPLSHEFQQTSPDQLLWNQFWITCPSPLSPTRLIWGCEAVIGHPALWAHPWHWGWSGVDTPGSGGTSTESGPGLTVDPACPASQ